MKKRFIVMNSRDYNALYLEDSPKDMEIERFLMGIKKNIELIIINYSKGVKTEKMYMMNLGISIHFALVAIICTLITAFLFMAYYDLKPAKTKIIQEKIMELKL